MSDKPVSPPPPVNRGSLVALKDCKTLGDAFGSGEFMERIKQGLPTHLNPNAMLRTYIQAVHRAPLIAKVETRQAIGAFLTLSQLGLMPNNSLGQAFLIPFARSKWNPATRQREVQGYDLNVVIGYKGYLDLAFRSGLVGAIHSDVVYETDEFDYVYGSEQRLKHRPTGKQDDAATPGYVYAVAHLTGAAAGVPPFRVMPWSDVLRTRNRSQAYQTALTAKETAETKGWKLPATYTEAPWVKHLHAMAMKTAFLRLSTWIPRSLEQAGAQAMDEAGDRGARIDFSGALDGGSVIDQTIEIQEHEPDADTAFGVRQQDEQPSQQGVGVKTLDPAKYASGETLDQATARVAADQQKYGVAEGERDMRSQVSRQSTPSAPEFSAYLCTEHGELAEINGGHFRDPVLWAEAYLALLVQSTDRAMMIENNEEALGAIFDHHPEAQRVLDAFKAGGTSQGPTIMQMPMKGRRMDLQGYIAAVRQTIGDMTMPELDAWGALNCAGELYAKLPPMTRKGLASAIQDRATAIRAETGTAATPEGVQEDPASEATQSNADTPEASTGAPDEKADAALEADRHWVLGIIRDIRATQSMHELEALARNPAIQAKRRMVGEAHPELLTQLKVASDEQQAFFRGAA